MKNRVKKTVKGSAAGKEIIGALTDLRDTLASGVALKKKYVVRHVVVPEPGAYSARAVKMTRARLGLSQRMFARLVGVSTILAQSWEQGRREPSPLARRLLDEINRDPARWASMVHSAA